MGGIAAVVIPSITSHEAAHGFVADRFGDHTARNLGRLTLNPIPHIDPLFTIALPALLLIMGSPILFGGAKPVPVKVGNLSHPRRDWALVGAAGPLTNLALAFGLSLALSLATNVAGMQPSSALVQVLAVGIYFNVLLCVFNLVPIPPLDGSRVFQFFLSGGALAAYHRLEQYGLLVILALLFFVPGTQIVLFAMIRDGTLLVTAPFGIEQALQGGLYTLFSS